MYRIASVYILNMPYYADRTFDYYIPIDIAQCITKGSIVTVPFGGGNRHVAALVAEVSEKSSMTGLKPLFSVNQNAYLTDELFDLCLFLKDYCFCTVGDAFKAILPSSVSNKVTEYYKITDKNPDGILSFNALVVYQFIRENSPVCASALIDKYTKDVMPLIRTFVKDGFVEITSSFDKPVNIKTIEYITALYEVSDVDTLKAQHKLRTPRQAEIYYYIASHGSVEYTELHKNMGATRAHIQKFLEKKLIKTQKLPFFRSPYGDSDTEASRPDNILSEEQTNAYNELVTYLDDEKPQAALLHGITGSGKTRVIISLIDKAICEGKQVIMLVPEIGLTPQTVGIFRSFYKDRVVVWHSSLSDGERYDAYQKIVNGQADICIGTRSAVFVPFKKLGLIIIDEEHEHTYKSEQSPRYNTIDVARFRAAKNNALMLLASATPSLESYYKASKGIYHLVSLKERYNNAKLPETVICDLKVDSSAGNISPLGEVLKESLTETLNDKNQAILFMNRRGFYNFLICVMCGEVIECPHCSVALTVHSTKKEKRLVCHYCGYNIPMPEKCPSCAFEGFRPMGFGTEKVEETITEAFPDYPLLRMDADTTSSKFSYNNILGAFREKKADILLGTQMVTKGHDFPDVTLVGVMLADTMIHLDDYSANERTFSLITQVIGRAGRGKKPGKAIIQTYSPDNPTLLYAAAQDYIAFYNDEIARRRALVFPPFCDIALIMLTSNDEGFLQKISLDMHKRLFEMLNRDYKDVKMVIFGPFEAPVYKINEVFRNRFVIKCRMNKSTRNMLSDFLTEFSQICGKKVTIVIDINPNNV